MHLFLRDRRPRRRSAALILAVALAALVIAFAGLRVDLSLVRALLPWDATGAQQAGGDGDAARAPDAPAAAGAAEVRVQIALARTYADLDRRADGLALLDRLADKHPHDGEIAYARASLLAQSADREELETAFSFYEMAAAQAPRLAALARLYQGVIRMRLGDGPGALAIWREHLASGPEEPYRSLFEEAIARAGG